MSWTREEVDERLRRIMRQIHERCVEHGYGSDVLGFTPQTLDGKVHKLEVRLKDPGMTARARKSYVASATDAGTATK